MLNALKIGLRIAAFCMALVIAAAMLCGCGSWRDTSYVVVSPHNETYGVALDSNTLTVSSVCHTEPL